ncbi:hypothetical protein [Amycolatopsis saalfeldensis]|uniref:Uncharacterized protein n=1 Tax=Amycolatopsis saalfeldensis TaxID=394193 RepID=A0A1H8YNA5_9PSEU|nr:hypothetical protein [Amycolatopsis saalfeldensis]SEP53639.1 hypothetical protein SAMN04489732_12964 [Amycolatopsis saalfeldensis]
MEHRTGDINHVGREVFHEVIDIEPGSMKYMMYGPGMNHWGYLDADGNYTKAVPPKGFLTRLSELNPHQR